MLSSELGPPQLVPFLKTDRLRLVPLREAHAVQLIDELSEPCLYAWMPSAAPPTVMSLQEEIRLALEGPSETGERWFQWVAWSREERAHVGFFEVTLRDGVDAYLGYLTFLSFWRRGYALEACLSILRFLREDVGARRVVAEIMDGNNAGLALARRLGFREADPSGPRSPHARYVIENS